MSYGVDAAVERMQAAPRDPPLDRATAEPESAQLRHRHRAVLPTGHLRHASVKNTMTVMGFLTHASEEGGSG
jgi:hypothetical protein